MELRGCTNGIELVNADRGTATRLTTEANRARGVFASGSTQLALWCVCAAGRPRSKGRSSAGTPPPSLLSQYAHSGADALPASIAVCQWM